MIFKDDYIAFVPGVSIPEERNSDDLWFIFRNDKILVEKLEDVVAIPVFSKVESLCNDYVNIYFLGSLSNVNCYSGELSGDIDLPEGYEFMDLRSAGVLMSDRLFTAAGKAIQIINWDKTHKYCGKCGSPTYAKEDERAKVCPECGHMSFPRLSPAVIVAVTRDNELLMAHNFRFANNMYSIIAGFVEPGENFEEAVKREVLEETGIRVKNIKYFSSQPWPFPNSLMIGFTAEYDSGEVTPDGIEIEHADWFTVDTLPNLPSKLSIARKLIDNFIERNKQIGE